MIRWSLTTFTLGATPTTHSQNTGSAGAIYGCFSVANNLISGSATGTDSTVTVLGAQGEESDFDIPYGTAKSWGPVWASFISVSGEGANVSLIFNDDPTPARLDVSTVSAATVVIPGTLKTDVGQGDQASGNTTLAYGGVAIDPRAIRDLSSSDTPGRSWTLSSSDTPSRSWNLTATDVLGGTPITVSGTAIDPRSIRDLSSSDTPGRSWNLTATDVLGGTPITVSGTAIDPRSIRDLSSSDVPGRSWTLSSSDSPGRSWTLSIGDAQGQAFTGGKAPAGGVWYLTVLGTNETPTLNSNNLQASSLATGLLATYQIAVTSGTTYTVSGCTVESGWLSVS